MVIQECSENLPTPIIIIFNIISLEKAVNLMDIQMKTQLILILHYKTCSAAL